MIIDCCMIVAGNNSVLWGRECYIEIGPVCPHARGVSVRVLETFKEDE